MEAEKKSADEMVRYHGFWAMVAEEYATNILAACGLDAVRQSVAPGTILDYTLYAHPTLIPALEARGYEPMPWRAAPLPDGQVGIEWEVR
jgi:hypothetical protein